MSESPRGVAGASGPEVAAGAPEPALIAALLVVTGALWIVGNVDLRFANSDLLVPVFTSLYRWTPFFWGETRFGMAIPWLASPVQDPVANLVTQKAIGHALGLLLPFLLARWLGGARGWIVSGVLGATTLVLALGTPFLNFFFVAQCYVPSATAAVAGMIVLDSRRLWRRVAGGLLLGVAFWITPSTLLWLAPMLLFRHFLLSAEGAAGVGSHRRLAVRLVWIGGLAVALAWVGRLVPGVAATPLGLAPVALWPETWAALVRGTLARLPGAWRVLLAGLALLLVGLQLLQRAPESRQRALRIALALVLGAAAQIMGSGLFFWVAQSRMAPAGWRYAIPSIVFLLLVPPFALGALLPAAGEARARIGRSLLRPALLALALALVAAALRLEPPSMARVRDALEIEVRSGLHLDPFARELIERRATHFLAPYWLAYPIAFRANSLLYREDGHRMVWPLAQRAEAARSRWEPADWSTARIAVLRRMPETSSRAAPPTFELDAERGRLGIPELERIESGALVDIYRGRGVDLPPG